MMETITHDNLHIQALVPVREVFAFQFEVKPNRHAMATFRGSTTPEAAALLTTATLAGSPFTAMAQEGTIYAGQLNDIKLGV